MKRREIVCSDAACAERRGTPGVRAVLGVVELPDDQRASLQEYLCEACTLARHAKPSRSRTSGLPPRLQLAALARALDALASGAAPPAEDLEIVRELASVDR